VLIKKYANRRLYHTGLSKHVTLDDLARIVREGATVRVVDANTGADLTRQVLTQVMLEQGTPLALIPIELLHSAIRYHGTDHQGAFAAFLSMVMKQFHAMDGMWEKQIHMMLEGLGTVAPNAVDPELLDPAAAFMSAPNAPAPLSDLRLPDDLPPGPEVATASAEPVPPEDPDDGSPGDDRLADARNKLDALLGRMRK
jgi:polyhydroxyalkanoate synthesis repressor PhaR